MDLSSLNFSCGLRKTILFLQERRFVRSRSSKVTDTGANRKRGHDFLLVRNSNLGPILHRFGDLTGLCAPNPTPIQPQFWGCSRCTRSPMLVSATWPWNYFWRIPTYLNTVPDRYRQTDRRTDGRFTVASPRSALASRGNYRYIVALNRWMESRLPKK